MARTRWLACGWVASLLYLVMCLVVPLWWPAYSSFSQTISELSAIDAPTRAIWFPLGIVYTLLVAAFGVGVWRSAGQLRAQRLLGVLLMANGLIGLGWMPMHQRAVLAAGGGTISDTLHLTWGALTVLLMLGEMAVSVPLFGSRFRSYTFGTCVVVIVAGAVTARGAPDVAANAATPWLGVWERISVLGYMLWQAVVSWRLARRELRKRATRRSSVPC